MRKFRTQILLSFLTIIFLVAISGSKYVFSQSISLQISVAGKELPVVGERRGKVIFVPIVAIARELGYTIDVDLVNEAIRVIRIGIEAEFNKRTSDIRENGVTVSGVPFASEVIFSPNKENILVPIEIIGSLLNVSLIVDDKKNIININSKSLGSAVISQKNTKFEMSGLDYSFDSTFLNDAYYQTFNLSSTGRIGSSIYSSNLSFIGMTQSRPIEFNSGNFTLRRQSGDEFQFGDLLSNTGNESTIMNYFIRGASYSRPIINNQSRIAFFGGRLFTDSIYNLDGIQRRFRPTLQFDTTAFGSRFSYNPLSVNPNTVSNKHLSFSAGTMFFSGKDNKGILFDGTAIYDSRKLNLFGEVAASNATYETIYNQQISGFGTGLIVRANYKVWDFFSIQSGYQKFSPKFTNSSRLNRFRDQESANLGFNILPLKNLSFSASAIINKNNQPINFGSLITREFKTKNYNGSLYYDPQVKFLPRFSVSANIIDNDTFGKYSFINFNASKDIKNIRFFGNYMIMKSRFPSNHGFNFGANVDAKRLGRFQVQQGLFFNKSQIIFEDLQCQITIENCFRDEPAYRLKLANNTFNVDWSPKENLFKKLYFTVGAGYIKDNLGTSLQFRSSAGINLPFKQNFQISYFKNTYYSELRFSLSGSLAFWKRKDNFSSQLSDDSFIDTSTIQGRVYSDENGNRQYDPGIDIPMNNIRVRLNNGRESKSDINGNYIFESVSSGEHNLSINLEDVRASLVPANGLEYQLTVTPRTHVNTAFRLVKAGSAIGRIWHDLNGNQKYDEGEGLIDIRVLSSSGKATYTDNDGAFLLSDLPSGEQSIFIDERYHPNNLIIENKSIKVNVVSGQTADGVFFLYKSKPREVKELNFGDKNTKP